MKKIAVSSLVSLFVLSCSISAPNNGRMQYAPTGHPLLTHDTSSHSPIKEDFTALAKKYNFAELEKEYKSFSTKALADTYVKKMFNKFLIVTPNSVQVIRQVEFSRYLKNNGDTSYETSLKNIFTDTPVLYSSLTGMPAVQSKMTSESGTFGFYILGVSPNQTVSTALPATNITETSFTANWSAVTGATSYILIVDDIEITGITGTNHTLNSLTAGSNHKYRVKAITSGVAGAVSNEINVNTVLTSPVAAPATSIGQTSLTANWSAVTGATSYTLVFNGTEITGITGTSHTINTLTPGTSYSYYVKAVNANTESVNSVTINTLTVPANPTASAATGITTSEFTANWSPSAGASKYLLTINGTETDVGNVTSYKKEGLPSYTNYTYSVKAENTSGSSPASNSITLKTSPVLTDGLALHLPFDGNANDISGYGHHGTLNNNPVMVNNAYKFDGTNYISVGAIPEVPADSDYAVSFWMKSDAIEDFRNALDANFIAGSSNNEGPRFEQYTNGDFGIMVGTSMSNFQGIYVPNKLNINNWHHVVASKKQNVLKFYVNKEEIGSITASSKWIPSHAFGNLVIGKGFSDVPQRAFKGLLDDIRIYSRPLTVTEIDQIYALTYPGAVYGLVAYYPFDGNANDISGYGHHGTLNNNPVLTTDKNGNSSSAYQFNGSNFINVGAIPEVPANSDFSVSFWMKSDIVENHRNPLDANFVAGSSNNEGPRFEQAHFVNSVSVSRLSVVVGTSLSNYDGIYGDNVIDSTNWHHISAIKNGSTLKLYLNSQEVSSLSSSSKWIPTPGFKNLVIGKGFSDSIERSFKGKLDNIRVYNRALTVAELQSLYNFGK